VRRRRLVLATIAVAVVAVGIATRPPPLSALDQTLTYWDQGRLQAWVALRPSPGPGAAPAPISPSVGRPRAASDAVSRASGRIFFSFGFDDSACSGTVLSDSDQGVSLVVTAAHCLYQQERSRFATNWLFVPGLAREEIPDCHARPTSCWTPRAMLVEKAYVDAGTFDDEAVVHDVGVAVIDGVPGLGQLDALAGSLPLADAPTAGEAVELVGYPGDRQYSGSALTVCTDILDRGPTTTSADVWGAACDMTGGASGGAWVVGAAAGRPAIVSVTSAGVRDEFLYAPVFDEETAALIAAAASATANTVLAR
jgi:V8-like Glu-specific endopeptidase